MATKKETPAEAEARRLAYSKDYTVLLDEIGALLTSRLDEEVTSAVGGDLKAPGISSSTTGRLVRQSRAQIAGNTCYIVALGNLLISKGILTEAEVQAATIEELGRIRDGLKGA